MVNIYYINSKGKTLDLTSWPYLLQSENLLDYEWNYDSVSLGQGGRITKFYREITEIPLTLMIKGSGKEAYLKALNGFHEVVEVDLLQMSPGKLYVNGQQYIRCYLKSSSKSLWRSGMDLMSNEVTLVTEYPFWCRDKQFSFQAGQESGGGFLDYAYDYPHDYNAGSLFRYLNNEHYRDCDFELIVYGPCINPKIQISGQLYEIKTTLYEGEYLKVDTKEHTVFKFGTQGAVSNEFNNRNKEADLFKKVPSGNNIISWDQGFGFDITLFQERSEPQWTL